MAEQTRNPIKSRKRKTAVVVIHGMGEQTPMRTLRDFVDAVWTKDSSLISTARPDSNSGGPRQSNPTWHRPDARNRSFELRRITTETADSGRRSDFYEFYWAHLMHGTTWEHLKVWLVDLLLRSPDRVPRDVRLAWVFLWLVTLVVAAALLVALLPLGDLRQCLSGACDPSGCDAGALCWTWVVPVVTLVLSLGTAWFVDVFLLRYLGDVARYVSATPLNIARRQEIREKGVELFETLMGLRGADPDLAEPSEGAEYDRIVVVAHSLGTIIAYDILAYCFARLYQIHDQDPGTSQPARHALEQLLRKAAADNADLDVEAFQTAQADCFRELAEAGSPWIVSDFVTLGSPLTHAEFLLAGSEADLRAQQEQRILPTCPPTLEWDQTTGLRHFSFWPGDRRDDDNEVEAALFRKPHLAAHFAYTRWTNIYSPAKAIFWGDIISGSVAGHFASRSQTGHLLKGVRDIAVLPADEEREAEGHPLFTHTSYWRGATAADQETPHHIRVLRQALDLGSR